MVGLYFTGRIIGGLLLLAFYAIVAVVVGSMMAAWIGGALIVEAFRAAAAWRRGRRGMA